MKLLIVRPQPGADATAKRVREAGFEPLVMPLFTIEPVEWASPNPAAYDALLLTSGNAVRMAGPQLKDFLVLPTYAVGSVTAGVMEDPHYHAIVIGTLGVNEIFEMAKANGHQNLLWLAGEDRTEATLPAGMTLDVRAVYRSVTLDKLPGFAESLAGADAVLLHSTRAARHFSDLCDAGNIDRSALVIAPLSAKIAEAAGTGWRAVAVAEQPTDALLLSALQRHFTTLSRDP